MLVASRTAPHDKESLIAQNQAGWAHVQTGYLSLSDDEVGEAMRAVADEWHPACLILLCRSRRSCFVPAAGRWSENRGPENHMPG
jgi:hypothetical protein